MAPLSPCGLRVEENNLALGDSISDPAVVKPVMVRFTDCTIPLLFLNVTYIMYQQKCSSRVGHWS